MSSKGHWGQLRETINKVFGSSDIFLLHFLTIQRCICCVFCGRCCCWGNVWLSEIGLFHAAYSQYCEERQRACSSMMKSPLPAWRFKLDCGVLSEAACAQGGQLSSLLPQTGILSTWQTSKSGVTLQSHAVIKEKYLCHNSRARFLILSLPRFLQKGVREASDLTFVSFSGRLLHRFKSSSGLVCVEVGKKGGKMKMWTACTAKREK